MKKWRKLGAPDEVERRLEEVEDLRRRAENPISLGADAEALKAEFSAREKRLDADYRAKLAERDNKINRYSRAIEDRFVKGEAASAIASARGNPRLLMPHVMESCKVVEESDGTFNVRVVDDRGEPRYRADGLPMGVADLVQDLRKDPDFAMSFEGTGSSGSGARGAGGSISPAGKIAKTYSKTEWRLAMSKAKPDERAQLMRDRSAGKITINE